MDVSTSSGFSSGSVWTSDAASRAEMSVGSMVRPFYFWRWSMAGCEAPERFSGAEPTLPRPFSGYSGELMLPDVPGARLRLPWRIAVPEVRIGWELLRIRQLRPAGIAECPLLVFLQPHRLHEFAGSGARPRNAMADRSTSRLRPRPTQANRWPV